MNRLGLRFIFLLFFVSIVSFLLWKPLMGIFTDIEGFKAVVLGFGAIGPLVLILIIALQVMVAPVPGQVAGFVSGFLYGVIPGTVYSMIGLTIGSYIVFFLSRKLGRPFVEKMVSKHHLQKFDALILKKGRVALFLIFLLPALPDDAVCFIAGLTRIDMKTLVLIAILGRLPGFIILNMVGAGVSHSNSTYSIILFSIFMAISGVLYYFREQIEIALRNKLHQLR